MKQQVIYVSLPITGQEDTYFDRWKAAQEECERNHPGAFVMTPWHLAQRVNAEKPHGSAPSDGDFMAEDVRFIIDRATDVFFCKGWKESKGCQVEMAIAKAYQKKILFQK